MRVTYHPAVQRDVNSILKYYDAVSPRLGDEFWRELMGAVERTVENPGRSHITESGLRRVNLARFPCHFLFRELPGKVRITVVRHNKRHSGYGTRRR
jgi:plasmid stabilization system protein ParE